MKKRLTFTYYCPLEQLEKTLLFRKKEYREKGQKRLVKFVKKNKELLRMMLVSIPIVNKKKPDEKRLLIYLYNNTEQTEEYEFLEGLLTYKYFRQLFGKVFYGLPYDLPTIPDKTMNDSPDAAPVKQVAKTKKEKQLSPVQYVEALLGQEETVIFDALDEFIKDINNILKNPLDLNDAKFYWKNLNFKDFPEIAQKDDDFKAAFTRLRGGCPFLQIKIE